MKVTLSNTSQIVQVAIDGVDVPARVWEGTTEKGTRVQALIVRIAVPGGADQAEFEQELAQQRAPTPLLTAFPLRMVL